MSVIVQEPSVGNYSQRSFVHPLEERDYAALDLLARTASIFYANSSYSGPIEKDIAMLLRLDNGKIKFPSTRATVGVLARRPCTDSYKLAREVRSYSDDPLAARLTPEMLERAVEAYHEGQLPN